MAGAPLSRGGDAAREAGGDTRTQPTSTSPLSTRAPSDDPTRHQVPQEDRDGVTRLSPWPPANHDAAAASYPLNIINSTGVGQHGLTLQG